MNEKNEAETTTETGQVCHPKTWVCKDTIMGVPLAEGEYETYTYPHTWRIVRFGKQARKDLVGRIKWFGEPYIMQAPDRSLRMPSVVGWELGEAIPHVAAEILLRCVDCDITGYALMSGDIRVNQTD